MAEDPTTKRLFQLAIQPSVVVKLANLPRIFGLSELEAASVLAALVNAGDVGLWPKRKALVLSAAAAARLNLEIVADTRGRLQWHTVGSPLAERRKVAAARAGDPVNDVPPEEGKRPATFVAADLRGEDGECLLDELPGPTSIELEDWGYPTWIMGLGMVWPGPSIEPGPGEKCKGCGHHQKMPGNGYCAICDRSGSRRLRTLIAPEPTRVKADAPRVNSPALSGGLGARLPNRKQAKKRAVKSA